MPEQKTPQILSGFVIKLLAFGLMLLDHIGFFLMNRYFGVNPGLYQMAYVFRCIGRCAMPLFALLCAEAIHFSKNGWKYFFRLLAMHIGISLVLTIYIYAIPGSKVTADQLSGNAFADLSLLALTLLLFKSKGWKKTLAILPIALAALAYGVQVYEYANSVTIHWFPNYLRPAYSLLGLLIGIGFFYARPLGELVSKPFIKNTGITMEAYKESKGYQKIVNIIGVSLFFLVLVIFWGISYIGYTYDFRPYDNYLMQMQSYCLLAIIPIYFYSGARGYDSKPFRIFSYLFYPVHLAILFLIFSI